MLSDFPLIPRKLLLGNPTRLSPRLSPDGCNLAWQAPVDGVMNIWVSPSDALSQAQPVTQMSGRPIVWHDWSADGRWIMFAQDENGDENYNLYVTDPLGSQPRNLTPMPKATVSILRYSPEFPESVLLGLNDRDPSWFDVWRVDLATGERDLVYENTDRIGQFICDWQGRLRFARRTNPEKGGVDLLRFAEDDRLEPWRFVPFEDTMTTWMGIFNRAGTHFSMTSSLGRNTSAMLRVDAATGEETVLAEHPGADVNHFLIDPQSFEAVAVCTDPGRQSWTALVPDVGDTLDLIKAREPDVNFNISSMSHDNTKWIATIWEPKRPATYALIDRKTAAITELFSARPDLKTYRLSGMRMVTIPSRDGLDLVSYLTLPPDEPPDCPREPLPMVLMVHGGPWARDGYDYRRDHQWLANRGYAVLSVNYRASTGFGKAFVNAGDKEHAAKIHNDLIDAVEWAIGEGVAARDKVAIMGWSYGGYSAFVGATFTPDVFCCAIPVVGITDLVTLMENRPPYWADFFEQFNRRYADVGTEEGRAFLRERSPIYKVAEINKPMLIGHGANDVRCTIVQSDAVVDAMKENNIPVTYVVFPDEGHGFGRPENNIAFHAIAEAFLAQHLGGRVEPVGEDFEGSSHDIRAGADILTGLAS